MSGYAAASREHAKEHSRAAVALKTENKKEERLVWDVCARCGG